MLVLFSFYHSWPLKNESAGLWQLEYPTAHLEATNTVSASLACPSLLWAPCNSTANKPAPVWVCIVLLASLWLGKVWAEQCFVQVGFFWVCAWWSLWKTLLQQPAACVCVIHIQERTWNRFLELLLMPDSLVLKEGLSGNSALQNSWMLFCPPDSAHGKPCRALYSTGKLWWFIWVTCVLPLVWFLSPAEKQNKLLQGSWWTPVVSQNCSQQVTEPLKPRLWWSEGKTSCGTTRKISQWCVVPLNNPCKECQKSSKKGYLMGKRNLGGWVGTREQLGTWSCNMACAPL